MPPSILFGLLPVEKAMVVKSIVLSEALYNSMNSTSGKPTLGLGSAMNSEIIKSPGAAISICTNEKLAVWGVEISLSFKSLILETVTV